MDGPEDILARAGVRQLPRGKAPAEPQPSENDKCANDPVERELRDIAQRIISAASLAYKPEPKQGWLVEDMIPDDNLTLFTGDGGGGKTTIAMQLGVAMQINGRWLNMPVKQGPVLFVSSEEKNTDLDMTLRAMLKSEGRSLADIPDLHLLSLSDRDACLATSAHKLAALEATPLWRAIEIKVERLKPRALCLDALADMFGGEENFRRHVRSFIVLMKRMASKNNMAVILIAHPSLTGMNSGSGLSGSTDWHNGPRARLFLAKSTADEAMADMGKRTLTVKKVQRSGMEGTVFQLRRKDGVFVYEGKDGGSTPYDRAAAEAKTDAIFLALLQTFEKQGRKVSPNSGKTYAPSTFEKEEDAQGTKSAAFAKAMSRLLKTGRIHIEHTGSPSRRASKLTPGPPPKADDCMPQSERQ
jgi:RecA-family ATPase